MRVGVVDLGTNSTRLLVADVDDGHVEEIDAQGAERVLAIGTSAIRDAENGEAFLGEVEWSYGWKTRLLTGEEEANLTCKGVADGHPLDSARVILDIGSVRLTERFLTTDPPTREELDACAAAVRDVLPGLEPTSAIGVAGTITTLAALELGRYDPDQIHRRRLSREEVEAQLERLASVPVEERRGLPGLEPERAPVIVAGAVIVDEVLGRYELSGLKVSERDLLHGAAFVAAELPEEQEGDAPPGAYTCC